MKSRTFISALALGAMGFGTLSLAQGNDRRGPDNDARRPQYQRGPDRRDDRRDNREDRDDMRRSGPPGYDNHRDARNDRPYGARGPQWRRGGHVPMEYRRRQYVVNDWRAHNLRRPPSGQQWVQVGADYALIAIATGVITQLILNNN